jgi:multicomponent Na+:H+ antiporter subunit D
MSTILVPMLVAVPLGGAFLIPLAARKSPRLADILANLITAALVVFSVALLSSRGSYALGGWAAPAGIVWVLDGLSTLMLVVVSVVSFAATVFSMSYMDRYTSKHRYYCLFLLMVAGMNGVVITGDLFNLFVFLEIAAISSYALVAFGCEHEELEASFRYLVLGSVGSAFVLLGIALTYGATGYLNMAAVARTFAERGVGSPLTVLAVVLFVVGFGVKAALVPFHPWLPDAHPSAPAPISAMLSGVLIKALGVYALARVLFNVMGMDQTFGLVLTTMGALSMTVGVFLAVGQWDFKRLLAYHSISQMGYVVLGIGLGGYLWSKGTNPAAAGLAVLGGIFHLANHAVFKSLLFLCSGAVEYRTGTRQLKEMGGLREAMPATRWATTIASLSIAGVPPFNGFWSKLLIVLAAFQAGLPGLAALTILVSFVTLVSFLKVLRYAFLGGLAEALRGIREAPLAMLAPMAALGLLCVSMGLLLLPGIREVFLEPAVSALRTGLEYAAATVTGLGG